MLRLRGGAALGRRVSEKYEFSAATFAWALQAACNLHRLPFTPEALLQQFAPPYSIDSIRQAAQTLGLRSGAQAISISDIAKLGVP